MRSFAPPMAPCTGLSGMAGIAWNAEKRSQKPAGRYTIKYIPSMTPVASGKISVANALPVRLITLATALALALIASMGWYVWNSVQVLHEVQARTFRLLALTGEIAYLNESVWASARLRMSTGQEKWRDRYQAMLARRDAVF